MKSYTNTLPAIKKMKTLTSILILIISQLSFGQTEEHKEKFRQLEPDIWLSIWDKENSSKSIQMDTLGYDDIPKTLDFRGTVVEALKWTDANGENILIQTVTGHFTWKDYDKDSTDYMIQDKSELYAYLFQKSKSDNDYKRKWRVYDYTECFGVDWSTGFVIDIRKRNVRKHLKLHGTKIEADIQSAEKKARCYGY